MVFQKNERTKVDGKDIRNGVGNVKRKRGEEEEKTYVSGKQCSARL